MATPINTIYSWFETGDFPTQEQFHASWSSFWHKDETIPMTTIDGLSDQFGKYVLVSTFNSHLNDENAHSTYLAKRDASNLTPTNVNDWKAKLGVGDLPENIATYDYDLHDHVMMKDGTTKEATDLGKNVANSSLTSVAGAGLTLGSSWTLNTNGQLYNITNLPDKSADASFNRMLVQNSTGQVAWGNGNTLIKNMPALLSDAEKTTWKTEMNGGWTTNTMSVAIISPPIVDRQDKPYWINLRGANLNLNPANFKIELCTGNSVSAATATVLLEIPGNQVQLYTNGTDLTFYYNFKDVLEGTYKLRIWNGVAYYLTSFTLNVVTTVNRVDLTNVIWSKKIYNDATSPTIIEAGSSVSYSSDADVKAFADDYSFVAARKSNQLVEADQDFYMTVEITGATPSVGYSKGFMTHFVGLVNTDTTIDLLNQTVVNVRARQNYWFPMTIFYPDNSTQNLINEGNTYGLSVIFMRRGGSWTIIITHNNQTLLYTKTGYTGAVAFGMYNQNTRVATSISANIVELYKF